MSNRNRHPIFPNIMTYFSHDVYEYSHLIDFKNNSILIMLTGQPFHIHLQRPKTVGSLSH